jgi:hypothetical protein
MVARGPPVSRPAFLDGERECGGVCADEQARSMTSFPPNSAGRCHEKLLTVLSSLLRRHSSPLGLTPDLAKICSIAPRLESTKRRKMHVEMCIAGGGPHHILVARHVWRYFSGFDHCASARRRKPFVEQFAPCLHAPRPSRTVREDLLVAGLINESINGLNRSSIPEGSLCCAR